MRHKAPQYFVYKMADTKINNRPLKIAVGTDNFKKMATEYDVFVDKTLFIKEIIDSSEEAILITHPRRWGKTLNLDMLKTFFEPESEECEKSLEDKYSTRPDKKTWGEWFSNFITFNDASKTENNIGKVSPQLLCNKDIFAGGKFTISLGNERSLESLQISSALDNRGNKIIDTYQGKYPVVFISLKDVVGNTLEEIKDKLKGAIKSVYKEHRYLENSLKLAIDEKQDFQKYINQDYTGVNIEESIKFLSTILHKHHGQRVYILVDEYDKPVTHVLETYVLDRDKELINEIAKLVTSILSACGKGNEHLEKIILTGIFDTLKKEGNSGFNNVVTRGISDQDFSYNFGFSEQEVKQIVTKFNFQDSDKILNNIKLWYNGYSVPINVGEYMQAYTPWAVMNYISDVSKKGEDFQPENYWTQSGASTILQTLLRNEICENSQLADTFRNLTSNSEASVKLAFDKHLSLFKYDLSVLTGEEKVFSYLLLNSGYLTVKSEFTTGATKHTFNIPNFELRQEFADVINAQIKHSNCKIYKELLDNLHKKLHVSALKAIEEGDGEKLQEIFSKNPSMKCNDPDLNFNYLHLASLSQKPNEIVEILINRCPDNLDDLLSTQDKRFSLNAKDYLKMSNNFIPSLETKLVGVIESLVNPSTGENVICNNWAWYTGYNLVIAPALTATVKLSAKLFTPKDIGTLYLYFIFAGTGTAVTMMKDSIKYFDHQYKLPYCSDYANYHSVLIEEPSQFTSLAQCKKYQQVIIDYTITLKLGENCENSEEIVTKVKTPIFSNTFYGDDELIFTLCKQFTNIEEQKEEL
jgi:hypothetical protein